MVAPASRSHSLPRSHSASISAGIPSTRYSFDADAQPLDAPADRLLVVRHRQIGRRWCRVGARHRLQQDRRVAPIARSGRPIERRKGDTPARTATVGGLMPTVPVKGGGLADGPPVSVAVAPAQRYGDRRRRPPDEPPEPAAHWAVDRHGTRRGRSRNFVGRAHGELVHVELAEHHGAVGPEVGRDRGLVVGRKPSRTCRRLGVDAFGEQVRAERHALQQPHRRALR